MAERREIRARGEGAFSGQGRACHVCFRRFKDTAALERHKQLYNHTNGSHFGCEYCGRRFDTSRQLTSHMDSEHFGPHYTVGESAFNRTVEVVQRTWPEASAPRTLEELYEEDWRQIVELVRIYCHKFKAMKMYFVFAAILHRVDESGEILDVVRMPMRTSVYTVVLYNLYQVRSILSKMFDEINVRFDGMEEQGSDLTLHHFSAIFLNFVKYNIAGGGTNHVVQDCLADSDVNMFDPSEESFINEIPKISKDGLTISQRGYVIDCQTHLSNYCFFTAFAMGFPEVNPVVSDASQIPLKELQPGGSRYEAAKKFIEDKVIMGKMRTPVSIKQLNYFESMNEHLKFALNVFLLEKKGNKREMIPMYLSKHTADRKKRLIINLLIVKFCSNLKTYYESTDESDVDDGGDDDDDDDDDDVDDHHLTQSHLPSVTVKKESGRGRYSLQSKANSSRCTNSYAHYLYITDLSKIMHFSRHKYSKKRSSLICPNCMWRFSNEKALKSHQSLCLSNKPQKIEMPEPGDCIKFRNYKFTVKLPLYATCDFETAQKNPDEEQVAKDAQNNYSDGSSYTKTLMDQVAITCSITFIGGEKKILEQRVFTAEKDLPLLFYKNLAEMWDMWESKLCDVPNCPPLTLFENAYYESADKCYLCNKRFGSQDNKLWRKVRDHEKSSLLGGRFLGPAHAKCNLGRQKQTKIPVFLHNMKGFDGNFILQSLRYKEVIDDIKRRKSRVGGLPDNTEHFKTINILNYRFLDSFSFLSMSLAKLIENLGSDYEFPLTQQMMYKGKSLSHIDMKLLTRKSVFPYEICTSVSKMEECKKFPPRDAFFSTLTQDAISEADYLHGEEMFTKFGCENMLEYLEIYCLLDTLLLADAVHQYRNATYDEFGLDICHYISSPQISFDIMLKTTEVSLDMISCPEQLNMIEQAIRGGVSFVDTRYVNLGDDFSPSESNEWILYCDCNNLYGMAMLGNLPVSDYEWVEKNEFQKINWLQQTEKQQTGFILEVDLSIPPDKHDYFKSFPIPCEKFSPTVGDLSLHTREIYSNVYNLGKKGAYSERSTGQEKLIGTLLPKTKYVIHYMHLKLLLELGINLDKVHRCLKFKQSNFLQNYVLTMTSKRMMAKSKSLANHYKLAVNSIYGKLIQSIRNYMTATFLLRDRLLARYVSDNRFDHYKIVGEDCVVFFRKQKKVRMNKAYVAGFAVLEKSKAYMGHTYYKKFLPLLGKDNISLIMSDTDSFMLLGKNCTMDSALDKLKPIMDFSNYPKEHPLFDDSVKQVPGYWKNEVSNGDIVEVVALKSKCYNFRVKPNTYSDLTKFAQSRPKCKGISSNFVDKLSMDMYRACVQRSETYHTNTFHIRSRNFNVSTIETRKMALNSYCNKRYLLKCSIHSLPYGHKDIKRLKELNDECPICNV